MTSEFSIAEQTNALIIERLPIPKMIARLENRQPVRKLRFHDISSLRLEHPRDQLDAMLIVGSEKF